MPTKKVSWATGKINKNSRRRRREGATNDVLFLTNCGRWDEGRARTMVKATTMLIVLSLYGYLLFSLTTIGVDRPQDVCILC